MRTRASRRSTAEEQRPSVSSSHPIGGVPQRFGNRAAEAAARGTAVPKKCAHCEEEEARLPRQDAQGGGAQAPAPVAAAPVVNHRFSAEGVSVVVRRSCGRAGFSFMEVELGAREALDKIFNSECIKESMRLRIQRNLRSGGIDFRCMQNRPDACAESTGYNIPANIFSLGSQLFPNHPQFDPGRCEGGLAPAILHEIVHTTRGFFGEQLPTSCEASCFGQTRGTPELCRDE